MEEDNIEDIRRLIQEISESVVHLKKDDLQQIEKKISRKLLRISLILCKSQSFQHFLEVLQNGFIELKKCLENSLVLRKDYVFFKGFVEFQIMYKMEMIIFQDFYAEETIVNIIYFFSTCKFIVDNLEEVEIQGYILEILEKLIDQSKNPLYKRKLIEFYSNFQENLVSKDDLGEIEEILIEKRNFQKLIDSTLDSNTIPKISGDDENPLETMKKFEYKDFTFIEAPEKIISVNIHEDSSNFLEIKLTEVESLNPINSKWVKKEYCSNSYQNLILNGKSELEIYEKIYQSDYHDNFLKVFFSKELKKYKGSQLAEGENKETMKIKMWKIDFLIEKCDFDLSLVYQPLIEYGDEELIKKIIFSLQDQLFMLHELGIIHNDLSIKNVMIKNGRSFLVDFNSSFIVYGEKTLIKFTKIGNQEFWPPELFFADKNKWSEVQIDYKKSEVFSFSLLLMRIFEKFFDRDLVKLVNLVYEDINEIKRFDDINKFFTDNDFQEQTIRNLISSSFVYDWAKQMILDGFYFNPENRKYLVKN
jgi:hypothetical protein